MNLFISRNSEKDRVNISNSTYRPVSLVISSPDSRYELEPVMNIEKPPSEL